MPALRKWPHALLNLCHLSSLSDFLLHLTGFEDTRDFAGRFIDDTLLAAV